MSNEEIYQFVLDHIMSRIRGIMFSNPTKDVTSPNKGMLIIKYTYEPNPKYLGETMPEYIYLYINSNGLYRVEYESSGIKKQLKVKIEVEGAVLNIYLGESWVATASIDILPQSLFLITDSFIKGVL